MRYTILSYIINNYEILHEVGEKDPDAEYIMVTDNPKLQSDTWNVIYEPDLNGLSVFDKCYLIRFNCFKYANTDICVRIDGSMKVKHSLRPLIDLFQSGNYDACFMPHPFNDNFIEEYNQWVKVRSYPETQAKRCIESMREKGYEFNYKGMFQGGFCILRRNKICRDIETTTYNYLKELGTDNQIERIDQIPLSFVINTKFNNLRILPVSEQILRSYYIQLYEHHGSVPNMNIFYDREKADIKYMFNKPVSCLYLDPPTDSLATFEKDMHDEMRDLCNKVKKLESQCAQSEGQIISLKNRKRYYKKTVIKLYLTLAIVCILFIVQTVVYLLLHP